MSTSNMSLLNAFVDSFVCVGFSSERGLTLDIESKSDAPIFTSNLQPTVLAIITNDRATYPPSRGDESFDSSYPPVGRLTSRNSLVLSSSSGSSTPSSFMAAGLRTPKQQILLSGYKDLPHYCFPDGVHATYHREKEKIHCFVLTQDGKPSYALALTFQQAFTLKTNKPDDDGVYHIDDYKLSTQNSKRSSSSKIPVPIEKQKTTASSTPVAEKRSRKMPSAFPKVDTGSANRTRSTSSHETDQQSNQPLRHYEVPTISSYQKNLSTSAAPPPLRGARTKSQGNVSLAGTTPQPSTSGMRKRIGSTTRKPLLVGTASSSTSSKSSPSTSTSDSTSTSSESAKPFYLPHCVVLIATQPYWTAMQETISIIYDDISRSNIEPYSKEYKKLIQKYAFLACNTPIPPAPWERLSLSLNVTNDRFVITFDPPINPNRSVLDLDLSILLLTLNIGKLLDILAAIFTEKPIIFFSSNYSTLVTTLECLLYLIYPLKWNNLYIPLVPDSLRDVYLEGSPGLFIKGTHPRHQSIIEKLNVSLTCNLDNDKNIFVPDYIDFHHIPPTKIHSFSDPITQLLEEIKVARAMKSVPTAARLPMDQQRELDRQRRFDTNEKISKIFLALMIDLYGDAFEPIYWKVNSQTLSATNTPVKSSNNERKDSIVSLTAAAAAVPVFMKETYLRPKIEGIDLEFYQILVETVAFQNLLKEEMISTSPTGFKQICQMRSLSKENQMYRFYTKSPIDDYDNQVEPTTMLDDSLSSQKLLPLPEWPSDLSTHYLDSCIDVFSDELENAQQEGSLAEVSVYAYLRGCARLARGDYLDGLRDLYLIENRNLFPHKYIETVIVPRLGEEYLLDTLLGKSFYIRSPEWKKVRMRAVSNSLSMIDIDNSDKLADPSRIPLTPDIDDSEWQVLDPTMTYQQFSDHVHRLNIILDQDTTETLFKALSYWTDNPVAKTLKKENTLTNNRGNSGSRISNFTLQHTLEMLPNHPRMNQPSTPTPKPTPQPEPILPSVLFELFLDIWQQTNTEKVRMSRHLPEDRHHQESILAVSSMGIVSKKDGPGQLLLTQKRLYFLPETRSVVLLLTELINIVSLDKYQHQTIFSSSKPGIKIHTSSTSSLPRDQNTNLKSKSASFEKDLRAASSISLFFKSNQEQELWHTIIVELWSGLTIAHEQYDTAVLNKASRHIALMDTLSNIDYAEEAHSTTDKRSINTRLKSKQRHNETSLEMALKDLSIFTRLRQTGTLKPLSAETRSVLTRRLSPSINEIERHAVRCLLFTEHPETGHSSLWCAYGTKLKVFNITRWICDPNDLNFPSLITAMCLDLRYKLWIRCINGELFIVDTLTRMCVTELETRDGENACQTIVYEIMHNHILTANRTGIITVWNASSWERLYDIDVLEIYRKARNIPDKTYVSQAVVSLRPTKESAISANPSNRIPLSSGNPKPSINTINFPDYPPANPPAEFIPSPDDKLERIQIYEDLLFACYHNDYLIVLRISNSNTYTYEHLISVEYKAGNSVQIDSFLVYNKQLWVSTGCIISVFNVNSFYKENDYKLLMKTAVDNDNLVTMLGVSGYLWAGSLNGNVYIFRMDKYELYKTFSGHRDSVFCLCPMLDQYVASGSAQEDTSIAIWENIQPSNLTSPNSTPTAKGTMHDSQGYSHSSATPKKPNKTGHFMKPIDML